MVSQLPRRSRARQDVQAENLDFHKTTIIEILHKAMDCEGEFGENAEFLQRHKQTSCNKTPFAEAHLPFALSKAARQILG